MDNAMTPVSRSMEPPDVTTDADPSLSPEDRLSSLIEKALVHSERIREREAPTMVNVAEIIEALRQDPELRPGVRVYASPPLPSIQARRGQLQTVLSFLAEGAKRRAQGHATNFHVRVEERAHFVVFRIDDDAPAIPSVVARLVTAGEQPKTTSASDAWLPRLLVVRHLVQAAGGVFSLETGKGGGTQCSFTWPRRVARPRST